MPFMPSVPMSLAPAPSYHTPYPWRFALGDEIYALGHPKGATFKVVGGELCAGCPHLHLVAPDGKTWRIPQLHCSSRPITFRNG